MTATGPVGAEGGAGEARPLDGTAEDEGCFTAGERVGVLKVDAEGPVEVRVVSRRVLVAEPPEPVAPFGREEGSSGEGVGGGGAQSRAGLGEQVPGAVLGLVADPRREVGPDP